MAVSGPATTPTMSNYVALASIPFFCMMLLALVVVIAFPQIATWLPELVLGVSK